MLTHMLNYTENKHTVQSYLCTGSGSVTQSNVDRELARQPGINLFLETKVSKGDLPVYHMAQ